jgi:hypothetical protein
MRRLLPLAAATAIALAACTGSGSPSPSSAGLPSSASAPVASAPPVCGSRMGVAGLIPPNYPSSSAADWTAMFESLHETGALLGVYTNWSDSTATEGQIPQVVSTAFDLASRYGFTPLVALAFHADAAGGKIASTVAWSDAAQRARVKQVAVAIAGQYKPRYLALGIEVNRDYETDPGVFTGYVTAYGEMYDAIKAASPATLVFPIFQLEMAKGRAYLMGGTRQPEWALLDRFAGRMDLAAFTTYPFLDYQSPAALGADYYAEIASHAKLPVALTEIGWPSAPISSAPSSGYGGTPDEQTAFVKRFFELTAGLDVAAELWAFPDDLNPGYPNAALASVSLRSNAGVPKPAMAAWQARTQERC